MENEMKPTTDNRSIAKCFIRWKKKKESNYNHFWCFGSVEHARALAHSAHTQHLIGFIFVRMNLFDENKIDWMACRIIMWLTSAAVASAICVLSVDRRLEWKEKENRFLFLGDSHLPIHVFTFNFAFFPFLLPNIMRLSFVSCRSRTAATAAAHLVGSFQCFVLCFSTESDWRCVSHLMRRWRRRRPFVRAQAHSYYYSSFIWAKLIQCII